jgi:glyoxylase-like metal-dependent hydrolase (beta-lactamase superfamily II)
MPSADTVQEDGLLQTGVPGLFASAPQPLPFDPALEIRSFLLRREAGNLLVYGSGPLERDAQQIAELGGIARQYLNHRHEASFADDWPARAFGARLHVHEREARRVSESREVDETFSERHVVDGDFEVIPIPGHTSGATAFLWDTRRHRLLFTGDTIFVRDGEWVAAVLERSDRAKYISSLELIRDLDFDWLVPWAASVDEAPLTATDRADTRRRLDAILERLRRGESS